MFHALLTTLGKSTEEIDSFKNGESMDLELNFPQKQPRSKKEKKKKTQ
jgi:hypothetical protein